MKETCERDGFELRSAAYFAKILDSFGDKARLYLAYYEGEPIAGAISVLWGDKVWYFYGASSNSNRKVMPNYLMQWEMIKWAIENNCRIYDFRGVAGVIDESNPLFGLYRFKHRFDVIELMKKEDYIPKAILVFDCGDRDINTQYLDFIKNLNQLPKITNKQNKIKIVFNYIPYHEQMSNLESRLLVNAVTSKNCMAYLDELDDTDMYKENKELKSENEELIEILKLWGDESIQRLEIDELIIKERTEKIKLQEELNKKEATISNLKHELEDKQKQINVLLSSNSWKITKPLRNMKSMFKKQN